MSYLCILLPLLLLLLCSGIISCSSASSCSCCDDDGTPCSFPSFSSDAYDRLVLLKDAEISNGALHLTPGSRNNRNKSGAALLPAPVTLWSHDSQQGERQNASFDTSFTMNLPYSSSSAEEAAGWNGEGLAFVVVPTLNSPPVGILGLSNNPLNASSSSTSSSMSDDFIGFKFNKVKQSYDPDDNRISLKVGVFISSLSPVNIINATIQATTTNYTVNIRFDKQQVVVTMDVESQQHGIINLSDHVPQRAFVGFLASTGVSSEVHSILSWNLTVKLEHDGNDIDWRLTLPAILGSIFITAIMNVFVAAFYFNSKYNKLKMELVLSETLRRLPGMPREFKYSTMRKATDNFHESRKLGKGGFGAVYKGTLWSGKEGMTCVEVAVKKFTRNENRCYDDFLAEIDIINRLRHRNIVPLVGMFFNSFNAEIISNLIWTLDQHLSPKEQPERILGWTIRYDIVMDIAAGLHYVHHEHEHMVLHRDIKASNIMLDSTFHGRLGDFGLARIVGLDKNSYTDLGVAGTWGFIAPEYSVSHKATRKTDIYAFGVLILEIVTGRRALSVFQDTFQLLTDWVWRLHREGRLLEAVDKNVVSTEDYNADGAIRLLLLGLSCTNPNPLDRPSMTEVVQVVAKSVAMPNVPTVKPTFVWPPEERIPHSFDDIMEMSDLEESHWEETSSSDALAASAIIRRKARVSAIG
ncbi:putative L-type lectin-domain containing receptor kinase S.5 [Dichanthelium oligosanthes]|uniref:Putative L-type lectin-domain containing receptor kinase S.5 n=1 Tax=Dichanthelium oligosanthes TaxID=888268 RepID=A0A1E5V500_9POAL|nr:putative L-type lectin-domain containing receptor kinase S.5 [Dichanthelium oligosanthes]